MGVSITASSRMILVPEDGNDRDWHYDHDHEWAFVLDGCEKSAAGLELNRWYAPTPETDSSRICSMSYGRYNVWREHLSRSVLGATPHEVWADPDAYADRPFFELINFADNEGTIGPVSAGDLLADFADGKNRDLYLIGVPEGAETRWGRIYDAWTGLELAADGGMVAFA